MSNFRRENRAWDGTPVDCLGIGGSSKSHTVYDMSGEGTLEDPYVYWTFDIGHLTDKRVAACTKFAREEALTSRSELAVIRNENHDTCVMRDNQGNTIRNRQTGDTMLEPADMHMTLDLGRNLHDLRLQGHKFLTCDEDNIPIRGMTAEDRKIVKEGREATGSEYWGKGGSSGYDMRTESIPGRTAPTNAPTHRAHQANDWRASNMTVEQQQQGGQATTTVESAQRGGNAKGRTLWMGWTNNGPAHVESMSRRPPSRGPSRRQHAQEQPGRDMGGDWRARNNDSGQADSGRGSTSRGPARLQGDSGGRGNGGPARGQASSGYVSRGSAGVQNNGNNGIVYANSFSAISEISEDEARCD